MSRPQTIAGRHGKVLRTADGEGSSDPPIALSRSLKISARLLCRLDGLSMRKTLFQRLSLDPEGPEVIPSHLLQEAHDRLPLQ